MGINEIVRNCNDLPSEQDLMILRDHIRKRYTKKFEGPNKLFESFFKASTLITIVMTIILYSLTLTESETEKNVWMIHIIILIICLCLMTCCLLLRNLSLVIHEYLLLGKIWKQSHVSAAEKRKITIGCYRELLQFQEMSVEKRHSKLAVFVPVETTDGKPVYFRTRERHILFEKLEAGVEYKIFSLDDKKIYIVPYIENALIL